MAYSRAKKRDRNAHLGHGHDYYTFNDPRKPAEKTERQKVSERLTSAVEGGDLEAVKSIFEELKALKRIKSPDLDSPFDDAILYGHIDIVKFFLSKGAKITRHSTATAGRDDKSNVLGMFKAFLDADAMRNPDEGDELLEWFLSNGAPAKGLPTNPGAPIRAVQSQAQAELLIAHGATLRNTSCLHTVIRVPEEDWALQMMTFYLDHGVDIDEIEWKGRKDKCPLTKRRVRDDGTALHVAVRKGRIARVKLLVDRGADLEIKTLRNGRTARDVAQVLDRQEIMEYLEDALRDRGILFQRLEPESETSDDEYDDTYRH
ncbi:MAG: hypothetical protein Q9183_003022 [Haloplaca sp. 2 TL-2023]